MPYSRAFEGWLCTKGLDFIFDRQWAMNPQEVCDLFATQYNRFTNLASVKNKPEFLAHYTSIEVLEKIIKNNDLWFSNPLFMNDVQEIRFGIIEGIKIFESLRSGNELLDGCGTEERVEILFNNFMHCFNRFEKDHLFSVYVFCLSEHDAAHNDGLLSMWRGYGGGGNGAAIVFKTDFIQVKHDSPLIFGKVHYASETERRGWIETTFRESLAIIKNNEIPDLLLHVVSHSMFELMKLYSMLSKHSGFDEEREWRIIYLPERDTQKILVEKFSYYFGRNGIEPKLHFPIEPLKIEPIDTWNFYEILHEIILGPSISNPLALAAVKQMFVTLKKSEFVDKLATSGIPYRSIR